MEKYFDKVKSTNDFIIIAVLIVAGLVFVVAPLGDAMRVIGYILIASGIIIAPFIKSGYKDESDGKRYSKKEIYFPNKVRNELIDAVTTNPENINLSEVDKGNAMRLDIFYSRTTGKAYLQLFEYVPYKYVSRTEVIECDLSLINKLLK